jgi:hypothetical protein
VSDGIILVILTLNETKGKNLTRGVILNPSPFVTLSEMKGLDFGLRVNSVKDLMSSFALLRTGFVAPPERDSSE